MLLVDADEAEPADRCEDGRAGADDHSGVPGRDALALVAPLGLGEARVEQRHALAEPRAEPSERLRRERDLRYEDDRAEAALEGGRTRPEVDLGLAAAGRAVEQEVSAAARVEAVHDPLDCAFLLGAQPLGSRLGGQLLPQARRRLLGAPRPLERRDERERATGRRPVVVRDPERELDESRRDQVDGPPDGDGLDPGRRLDTGLHDDAAAARSSESNLDDRALLHSVRHLVRERPGEGARGHERVDGGEAGHRASVVGAIVGAWASIASRPTPTSTRS